MAIYGNMVVPSKARGAGALPTDNSERNVYQPGAEVSARYSDAGGVLATQAQGKEAEGLQGLARGIGQLPGAFVAIYDRQRRLEMARAQEYVTQMQNSYINEQNYLSKLRGADAVGASGKPDVMAHYAKWKESAVNAMPKDLGEFGTRYAKMHLDTILGRGEGWAQRYQDSQLDAYQESTIKASLQAKQDMMALSGGDPQQWAQAAGEGRAQIEMMGQRLGWSQEVIDQKVKEFETKGVQGLLGSCLANGDLNGALQAMNMYGPRMGAQEFAQAQASLNSTWKQLFGQACQDGNEAKMKELMDWAKSAKLRKPQARVGGGGRGIWSVPTYTGVARVMAYHESGTQGSLHVSYGLQSTDGAADVGKYSFITGPKGGAQGGSVGAFIRFAGTKGGVGARLYNAFNAELGGDWKKLDNVAFWKNKGEALWKSIVQSDPAAFEALEDEFALQRVNSESRKLRPQLQAAIQADQTGALREMVISTVNQHGNGVDILNRAWDAHGASGGYEPFIRAVYEDRGNPYWFRKTKDPSMGRRRMKREVVDVLDILHGGGQQKQEPQQAQASGKGGDNIITAETMQAAEADYAPVGLATTLWGQISKLETQAEREAAARIAVGKIENPVLQQKVDSFLAHKLRLSKKLEEDADSAKAQEVLPMIKGMGREEARVRLQTLVDGKTITQAQAARVYKDAFEEPKDNPETRAALNQLLYDIDDPEKKIVSSQQLEYICMDRGLTTAQTHEALKYFEQGGSAGKVKVEDVKDIYYNEILNNGFSSTVLKAKNLPEGYLNVVLSLLPKGKVATREDLKEACVNAAWKSNEWFGGRYYEHVYKHGTDEGFVPDFGKLTAREVEDLRGRAMETFGIKDESKLEPKHVSAQFMKERGMFNVKRINRRAK